MQQVLQMLESRDSVHVAELAETFSVSAVTVRSDLSTLAKQGLVARIRGGVRALQHGPSEVGFDLRLRLEVQRKRAVARAVAALVGEGEAIALDASTTAYYVALELRKKRELVVVTNGLLVATALADAQGISVLVTGGMLRLSAMSVVGDLGTGVLRTTRINHGFLGARGLSLERGLMDLNPDEVRIKQEMANACDQVFGIVDATKSASERAAAVRLRREPDRHRHRLRRTGRGCRGLARGWRRRDHRSPDPAGAPAAPPAEPQTGGAQRRGGGLMAVMAAVDLGARSGRVSVGRFDGGRLTVDEVHRFANEPVQVRGTLHWDVLRLYHDVLDGLRAVARDARVDSVAVDSWGVDFGLLDRSGRLIGNPVHYRDGRRAAAVEQVYARIPPRELYDRTGIQLMPINTVFELAAMADDADPALEAARTLLLVPDLFHYWLCGSTTTEFTNATTTQCFDPRAGGWASDLVERLGIPAGLLPEIVQPGTPLGPVAAGVSAETGLRDVTVVAAATHDTGSAVAAVPFRRAGSAFLSVGTWSLVGLEVDGPRIDDATFGFNLTNEGGVAGAYRLLRNVTGLWLLDECRRSWALDGSVYSFEELVALAGAAPALRSLIDPDDPVFAPPGDMPRRVAEFCARTGQPEPADTGAVARCILESLALRHAQVVALLGAAVGRKPEELHVVGGGARNELLCRWTAQAAGLPVLAGPEEATLIGNLLVQAMALGEIASLDDARTVVRDSFGPVVHEPDASPGWPEARERFARLTDARTALEAAT